MSEKQANNLLHGITLENIVNYLVEFYGWDKLGKLINIRCFNNDPSVKSSLKFLRKTPWARTKVETLYLCAKIADLGHPLAAVEGINEPHRLLQLVLRRAHHQHTVAKGQQPAHADDRHQADGKSQHSQRHAPGCAFQVVGDQAPDSSPKAL